MFGSASDVFDSEEEVLEMPLNMLEIEEELKRIRSQ